MASRMKMYGTQYTYHFPQYILYVGAHTIKSERENNNDTIVAYRNVFAVADAAGSLAEHGIASSIVGRALRLHGITRQQGKTPVLLESIIKNSHEQVLRWKAIHNIVAGTTASFLRLYENGSLFGEIAHVGDSRIYKGNYSTQEPLTQLTEDQNEVKKLLEAGEARNSDAVRQARKRPMLLGTRKDMNIDSKEFSVQHDDFFLLCTDGLTRVFDRDFLSCEVYALWKNREERTVAQKLNRLADELCGADNSSVVLVRVAKKSFII